MLPAREIKIDIENAYILSSDTPKLYQYTTTSTVENRYQARIVLSKIDDYGVYDRNTKNES
jgi:hypothetical protein